MSPTNGDKVKEAKIRRIQQDQRHSIQMMADRILVASPKELGERRSRGGILIPATVASETRRAIWGEVIDVGPMVRNVLAGDLVLFVPETAAEVEIREEEYIVLRERDIHAVASERSESRTGLYL
ncbi:MAG TPA: co-chaperone GroES [Actinomycetota bacterium]|nr:co-chaperone GroES [Actinomycetota bacterium]